MNIYRKTQFQEDRPTNPCPKCSPGTNVAVAWHKNGGYSSLGRGCGYYPNERRADEHLHYTCRNCGYDWTGDVASAD